MEAHRVKSPRLALVQVQEAVQEEARCRLRKR